MTIDVTIQEIEQYTTKDNNTFHRVIMLEKGTGSLRQFMGWSVRDEFKRDIAHLKEGSNATFKIKNITSNYDGSLKVGGELVKS